MSFDAEKFAAQFSNLEFDNIGNWPLLIRFLIIGALCGGILAAGYYLDTQDQQLELERAKKEEDTLWQSFEQKQKRAVNLDAYKAQMAEMKESFGTMLRQLPSKNEVAELLVDITQTGLMSGLEFNLFKPEKEVPKEFYAELPITLDVNGKYYSLGQFVSGVAALPRIVTIHDVDIKVGDKDTRRLSMKATAKTYRYLDEEELAAGKQVKPGKKRRK